MKKFLLLDADGVAIEPAEQYFSVWYAEKYNVPKELFASFFKNEYRECQLGNTDLKEQIEKHLNEWKWAGTVDEFLRYWFEMRRTPRTIVLEVVRGLRQKDIKCYIASNQEKYRAEYLWKEAGLSADFDGAFFSYDLRAKKNNTKYWELVLSKLGNPDPSEVEFWDDDKENIEVAKSVGIDAHFFTTVEEFNTSVQ